MAEETGGLLDFIKSPEGMGLLSALGGGMAGARRGSPWNTAGAALVGGLHGYTSATNNQLEQQQKKFQLGLIQQAANEMGANPEKYSQNALTQGAASGDVGPTVGNAQRMSQYGSQSTGMPSLRTIQLMGLAGMKNVAPMFNVYKYVNDGVERKPGSIYRNPLTGLDEYIPDIKTGITYDPVTKKASLIDGFVSANNAIEGGKADAVSKAQANYDLLTPSNSPWVDGRPSVTTRGAVVAGVPGQNGAKTPVDWRGTNQTYGKGQQWRESDRLAILQQEYASETNPQNKELLRREIARMGAQPGGGQPYYPTPAEQTGANKSAELQATLKNSAPGTFAQSQQAVSAIDELLRHPGINAATGLQGTVDPRNYIPGTDAYNFKTRLDQIKGQTFLQAYNQLKGGGQITEIEGKKAENALARLNSAQSTPEFTRALNDYKSVIQTGMDRLNGQLNGAPPTYTGQQQASQSRPAATQPAQQSGIVMSKSGKPMVQVNGQWHYVNGASGNW